MLQIFNSLSVYSWKIIHYDMFPWDEFVIHMSTIGDGKIFCTQRRVGLGLKLSLLHAAHAACTPHSHWRC